MNQEKINTFVLTRDAFSVSTYVPQQISSQADWGVASPVADKVNRFYMPIVGDLAEELSKSLREKK